MTVVHRVAAFLTVVAVLLVAAATLLPRSLFLDHVLTASDVLFAEALPWRGDPPPDYSGPRVAHARVAAFVHEPNMVFADRTLRTGRLPAWNPSNGFGEPFLGHARVGAFNPLDVARFVAPADRLAAWRAVACFVLAGLFAYGLLRRLGLLRSAALFGAAAYALNGMHVAWIHLPDLRVAALLPLVIWMVERLFQVPGPGSVAGLALAIGLVLLGDHPETARFVLVLGGTYAVVRGLQSLVLEGGIRRTAWSWTGCVIGAVVGVAVGWLQVGLTLEDGGWSWRWSEAAFGAVDVLGLFGPGVLGDPTPTGAGAVYVGVMALFAAVVGVFTGLFADGRVRLQVMLLLVWGWSAVGAPGVPALGAGPMVLGGLLAVAVLAALGLERCLPAEDRYPVSGLALWCGGFAVFAGMVGVLVAFGLAHRDDAIGATWTSGELPYVLGRLGVGAAVLVIGGGVAAALRYPGHRRILRAVPLVLVVLDLWLHGHPSVGEVPRDQAWRTPSGIDRLRDGPRRFAAHDVLPPRVNLVFGFRDIRGSRSGGVPAATALIERLTGGRGEERARRLARFGVVGATDGSAPEACLYSRFATDANLDAVVATDGDPGTVLLSAAPGAWTPGARRQPVSCPVRRPCAGLIEVDVPPRDASTVLVVREAYHPDWRSTRAVVPADTAFLGVVLGAGEAATIALTFRPRPLEVGRWISGAGAVVIVVLLLARLRRRREDFPDGLESADDDGDLEV